MKEEKKKYERPMLSPMIASMPNKVGVASSVPVCATVDSVPVRDLVSRYGSPLFIFSEQQLCENIRRAKRAFGTRYPSVVFAWSYKTNYLSSICRLFHSEGSWAEVVSGFEYQRAIDNGCHPSQIIFNGPSKSDADLALAVQNGSLIHLDNIQEIFRLAKIVEREGKKARVAVRVNLDAGVYPQWSRFGFNLESGEAMHAIDLISKLRFASLEGLHCHIGTFVLSVAAYRKATEKMAALAADVETAYGHSIQYIDMGGGFASKNTLKGTYMHGEELSPSFDDYAEAITSVLLSASFPSGKRPTLILETGRALVDDAGFLATTVLAHKRMPDGLSDTVIDAGVNLLFTSYWYNHKVSVVESVSPFAEETRLTGPLCMQIDVVRERVSLPLLNRGDLLLIHYVGAYNVSQWMQFIEYRPAVVMVRQDKRVEVLRRREDLAYMTLLEK